MRHRAGSWASALAVSVIVLHATAGTAQRNNLSSEPGFLEQGYCSGSRDATAVVQDRLRVAGVLVVPANCVLSVSNLVVNSTARLVGYGPSSVLRQLPGVDRHLLSADGPGTALTISALTIDGNRVGDDRQSSRDLVSVRFAARSGPNAPARLEITDATFLNSGAADVWVSDEGESNGASYVDVRNSKFFGGQEGTASRGATALLIQGPVSTAVEGSVFNLLRVPQRAGRAGISIQRTRGQIRQSRVLVTNNRFIGMGRADKAAIGAIDVYSGAGAVVISGNIIDDPYGRGIEVKGDSCNVSISNNVITGLSEVANYENRALEAQIILNPSPSEETCIGYVITGNVLARSAKDAVVIGLIDSHQFKSLGKSVIISGNSIFDAAETAINVRQVEGILIATNHISQSGAGIRLGTNVRGTVSIHNNAISDIVAHAGSVARGACVESAVGPAGFLSIEHNQLRNCAGGGVVLDSAPGIGGVIRGNAIVGGRHSNPALVAHGGGGFLEIRDNVLSQVFGSGLVVHDGRQVWSAANTYDGKFFRQNAVVEGGWLQIWNDRVTLIDVERDVTICGVTGIPDGGQAVVNHDGHGRDIHLRTDCPSGGNLVLGDQGREMALPPYAVLQAAGGRVRVLTGTEQR